MTPDSIYLCRIQLPYSLKSINVIHNRLRKNQSMERITIDPAICHGKPTIRGLRYPVDTILELLSSGMTIEEILADYEDLEREDILAVLAYATRLSRIQRIEILVA